MRTTDTKRLDRVPSRCETNASIPPPAWRHIVGAHTTCPTGTYRRTCMLTSSFRSIGVRPHGFGPRNGSRWPRYGPEGRITLQGSPFDE
jgi:hypothetical protein